MNREIKFRVWSNGRMVHPFYQTTPEYVLGWYGGLYYVDEDCTWDGEDETRIFYLTESPDSTIMMQYTGLKDKNGKEIYEGDIVRVSESMFKTSEIILIGAKAVCHYDIGVTAGCVYGYSFGSDDISDTDIVSMEVLGNKYENPELLKKVDDR